MRNLLAMTSGLALLRLDAGKSTQFSPSAPVKLLVTFAAILLTSLSRNYLFVLIMLALVLLRVCLLPRNTLPRVASGALTAALLSFVIMLPAIIVRQPQSALWLGTKAFVSTSLALVVALTTPHAQLTRALRTFGLPSIVIMTIDLTLRSIVSLGRTAEEALTALTMRSVGKNRDKQASLGGVGGIVLIKASVCAQDTLDAMRCRGFTGEYHGATRHRMRAVDAAWIFALALLCALFLHLQGAL